MCASCHARVDPLGFALENFDGIGSWRAKDGNFPIDTAGTLPDGTHFKGYAALRAILKADARAIAECLAEKLLIYALGKGLERADRGTVQSIAAGGARHDQRFSIMV